jgi:hypothetical protein
MLLVLVIAYVCAACNTCNRRKVAELIQAQLQRGGITRSKGAELEEIANLEKSSQY